MIVFLDTNILGLISNENIDFDEGQQCQRWFSKLLTRSVYFITSDVCDYEVRRGLISSSMIEGEIAPGIGSLDALKSDGLLEFLPVSTKAFELAADLWARASTSGQTTRDRKDIDFDIIISAQYQLLKDEYPGQQVIVATTNLRHLSLFCEAAQWRDINL